MVNLFLKPPSDNKETPLVIHSQKQLLQDVVKAKIAGNTFWSNFKLISVACQENTCPVQLRPSANHYSKMIFVSFGAGLLVFVQLSEDWLKINAFPCESLMVVLHLKYSHHKMCLRTIWRQYSYLYATAWSQLASIGGYQGVLVSTIFNERIELQEFLQSSEQRWRGSDQGWFSSGCQGHNVGG